MERGGEVQKSPSDAKSYSVPWLCWRSQRLLMSGKRAHNDGRDVALNCNLELDFETEKGSHDCCIMCVTWHPQRY